MYRLGTECILSLLRFVELKLYSSIADVETINKNLIHQSSPAWHSPEENAVLLVQLKQPTKCQHTNWSKQADGSRKELQDTLARERPKKLSCRKP